MLVKQTFKSKPTVTGSMLFATFIAILLIALLAEQKGLRIQYTVEDLGAFALVVGIIWFILHLIRSLTWSYRHGSATNKKLISAGYERAGRTLYHLSEKRYACWLDGDMFSFDAADISSWTHEWVDKSNNAGILKSDHKIKFETNNLEYPVLYIPLQCEADARRLAILQR